MNAFFKKNFADIVMKVFSKPSASASIFIFDLSFAISFFILQFLFSSFAKTISPLSGSVILFLLLSILYYSSILLAYSFFKYCILSRVKSFFSKYLFSFGRFWKFFLLNMLLGMLFLGLMLVLNYLLAGIKAQYRPYAFLAIAAPYITYLYFSFNISHVIFHEGGSVKKSLKDGLGHLFKYPGKYIGILAFSLASIAAAGLVIYILGFILQKIFASYLIYYHYYVKFYIAFSYVTLYFVVFINRINFYSTLKGK